MSDLGFVNRRDAVRAQPPRRGPPQQQQMTGAGGPAGGASPRGPPMGMPPPGAMRPPMPRPQAPPVRQFQQQPQQTTTSAPMQTPVSILKRPAPVEEPVVAEAASASPVAAAPSFDSSALEAQIAELRATVSDLTKKLASESKASKESSSQFYGLVSASRVLLFDSIPKEFSVDKATAKADKNTWVKLSYPQLRVERTLANGSTTIDLWLRAYAIDPVTSNISAFWAREKTADDTPAFSRFAWYPTSA